MKKNASERLAEWNPLHQMREWLRWDPFREMAPTFSGFPAFERLEWSPTFDVTENKEAFLFKADVPGVKKEDLEITASGNRVQISGKRDAEKEAKSDTLYTYERQYGSFLRSFTLPEGTDLEHAKSELKDGVLTLVIPKLPGAQAKKIPISITAKS
ncbi:MAG TPA: Hsp20/alpha crystallin family protein [Kofleriaceae bacterium]